MADAVTFIQQATDATDAIFQSRCEKNSEQIDSTSDATFNFSHKEESEIASVASVPLPVSDTASAATSEIASATVETASGDSDSDWTIEGAIATASANVGDALEGLALLVLYDGDPTEADLSGIVDDMMAATAANDKEMFEVLRGLYSRRWLQLAAHEIRKAKPESYVCILGWLTETESDDSATVAGKKKATEQPEPPLNIADEAAVSANDFPFPQMGDLLWRNAIPAKHDHKAKVRSPLQPGCVCRVSEIRVDGAMARDISDDSQYIVSRHAWTSGLFVPYTGQDR